MSYIPGLIVSGPGGKCKCKEFLHRTKATVAGRWAVTLDADHADLDLPYRVKDLGLRSAVHTTWSSSAEEPRYRVIIQLSDSVNPLEYAPIARFFMRLLGKGSFDTTCDQASRLMYLPSSPNEEDYLRWTFAGSAAEVGFYLDLAGGADVDVVREAPEVEVTGLLTRRQDRQLRGLCVKMAGMGEGNRDSYLLWALKAAIDDGMDPEIAGEKLAEAAIYAGLEEDVVWEKIGRILE